MLTVFVVCFGLATTAFVSDQIKFVGGCEINEALYMRCTQRFPEALCARDLRKLVKDIRRGKARPPECDIMEGTVTCQSRSSMRHMQRPSKSHLDSHDLFYVQTQLIGFTMPKYVVLELTSPDTENAADYRRVESTVRKLNYTVTVTRRTPSAFCGDGTCRHRYTLIGVRKDITTVPTRAT